jgi:uncharacterized protein
MSPLRPICVVMILLLSVTMQSFAQPLPPPAPYANQLKDSLSPYLAIHGDDPVFWQEWNPATLALARAQNKLLFVSIGYFSCHWCHVMQAESYRDAQIAALINENFIPVKVDRELEVALDAEMIAFAQRTLESAGWPLNVFVTPEGYPLFAALYEKPERFRVILASLAQEWQADSAALKAIAQKAVKEERKLVKIKPTADLAAKYRQQLVQETLAKADFLLGGLNLARKFPLSPQLSALLEIESRQPDARLAEWLRLTLDQMAAGGLRDHVGGGFFRYTVDPDWHTPHFEKMLYDNAQLAMVYLQASKVFNHPAYRDIAIETLDFLLAEMRAGDGFVSSISALNDKAEEGAVYLWTEEQLKAVLDPEEYALAAKIWGMERAAEFDFGYLPMNRKAPALDEQPRLRKIYAKLLQARKQRISPKDSKLLTGLNGLALAAFSEAAELAPRYRQAADALQAFMLGQFWQNGVLHKGVSRQQLLGHADLEAYAYAARGLMRYAQLSNNAADMHKARQSVKIAWHKFYTPRGFLLEEKSGLAKPYYHAVLEDGPLPSPSAVLIDSSLRWGDRVLQQQARSALEDSGVLQEQGVFWFASQVTTLNRIFEKKGRR